jgi:hypothetical protein
MPRQPRGAARSRSHRTSPGPGRLRYLSPLPVRRPRLYRLPRRSSRRDVLDGARGVQPCSSRAGLGARLRKLSRGAARRKPPCGPRGVRHVSRIGCPGVSPSWILPRAAAA